MWLRYYIKHSSCQLPYSLHLNLGNRPTGTLINLHCYVGTVIRRCTCTHCVCRSCNAQCSYIGRFIRFAHSSSHPSGRSSNDNVFTFHFYSCSGSPLCFHSVHPFFIPVSGSVISQSKSFTIGIEMASVCPFSLTNEEFLGWIYVYFLKESLHRFLRNHRWLRIPFDRLCRVRLPSWFRYHNLPCCETSLVRNPELRSYTILTGSASTPEQVCHSASILHRSLPIGPHHWQ